MFSEMCRHSLFCAKHIICLSWQLIRFKESTFTVNHFFWFDETKVPGSASGCTIRSSVNGIYSQFIYQITMNADFVDFIKEHKHTHVHTQTHTHMYLQINHTKNGRNLVCLSQSIHMMGELVIITLDAMKQSFICLFWPSIIHVHTTS